MRAGWGDIRVASVCNLATTICAKTLVTFHAAGMSKCSSGRCIRGWYFSLTSRAIKVPASFQRLPFPSFFPTSSPRKFKGTGTGLYVLPKCREIPNGAASRPRILGGP